MFWATICPSSGADDCVIFLPRVGIRLHEGCQDQLAGSASIGHTTCQPDLTTFLQPRHIPTRDYNITQSSAPDDGHMVARNMLSNY